MRVIEGMSPEGREKSPRIRIVLFDGKRKFDGKEELDENPNRGRKMKDVFESTKEFDHAGDAEMRYIVAHPESPEAKQMKDGKAYFFFGATFNLPDLVPNLRWNENEGKFNRFGWWLHESWDNDGCRMVLKG